MLESQSRSREIASPTGAPGERSSIMSSGVLLSAPGNYKGAGNLKRGWDWRARVHKDVRGEDILMTLRLGLARSLSFGALGPDGLGVW
jgi:hypothetical protein